MPLKAVSCYSRLVGCYTRLVVITFIAMTKMSLTKHWWQGGQASRKHHRAGVWCHQWMTHSHDITNVHTQRKQWVDMPSFSWAIPPQASPRNRWCVPLFFLIDWFLYTILMNTITWLCDLFSIWLVVAHFRSVFKISERSGGTNIRQS